MRSYTRNQYTILTYLGDVGGLIDIVWIVGGLISAALTRDALAAAMIRNSYQVQGYNGDNCQYYETTQGGNNQILTPESHSENEDNDIIQEIE